MANSNMPAADSQIIATLADRFNLRVDDICAPIMAAKSFLMDRAKMQGAEAIFRKADLSSGPGLLDALKLLGGLYLSVEGILIIGNATKIGVAVVEVVGIGTVSAATGALIGIGMALLGAYLLYKGAEAIWPLLKRRLMREFGPEALSFLGVAEAEW